MTPHEEGSKKGECIDVASIFKPNFHNLDGLD